MSRIHEQIIDLKEVIHRSQYILVVKKDLPELTRETIPIHADSNKYPPFIKVTYHFTVQETLKSFCAAQPGTKIDVVSAGYDRALRLHKQYYLEGLSKSYIEEGYASSLQRNYEQHQELIIFLVERGRGFELTVKHAWEDVRRKDKIQKILAAQNTRDS